jgi:hypothetical protein
MNQREKAKATIRYLEELVSLFTAFWCMMIAPPGSNRS